MVSAAQATAVDRALAQLAVLRRWLINTSPSNVTGHYSVTEQRIVFYIFQHGPQRVTDLARSLNMPISTTSVTVTRLEKADAVRRELVEGTQIRVHLSARSTAIANMVTELRKSVVQ